MFTVGLIAAATTATKWLIAGKIMIALGTGAMTAAPAIERMRKGRK